MANYSETFSYLMLTTIPDMIMKGFFFLFWGWEGVGFFGSVNKFDVNQSKLL